jgi:hypothetical protein
MCDFRKEISRFFARGAQFTVAGDNNQDFAGVLFPEYFLKLSACTKPVTVTRHSMIVTRRIQGKNGMESSLLFNF